MTNSSFSLGKTLSLIVCIALTAGCVKRVYYRGKAPDPEALATIQIDKSTKEDVLQAIGSPSFETQFGPKVWYYVSKKEERKAFFDPEMTEKHTIAISFTSQGVVKTIDDLDPDQPAIVPVEDVTPSAVPEKPLVKQIFANFGRIAKKSDKDKKKR